jgi:pyruvate dehydrogenase E1 component alpha subunit
MIPVTQALWMYERMVLSRYFEEKTAAVYFEGKLPLFNMANGPIPGEMHLSNGQEPCAVGVCAHLDKDDVVTATHRPHHIAIAKGVDLDAMTAEILGRRGGLAGGRGGHMHLIDTQVNFMCAGIVAEGLGPAAGAALARKMRGESGVAVAFIGDGAVNQGAFHEVMNLAALWKLPFVCVIEDNAYGISVAKHKATAVQSNHIRAAAYGIPGIAVANNEPEEIYAAAADAVGRARAGEGPTLIEIATSRLAGHFVGDVEQYRPAGERDAQVARDPIPMYRAKLIERGSATAAQLDSLEQAGAKRVEAAFAAARISPEPNPEEALQHVFA